jgi:CheY-like chemotaxis protein
MSPPVRIALLGFTPFERDQLRASLAPRQGDAVVYASADDLASCNLALANADDEAAMDELQRARRLAGTVVLGTAPRPGAAAQLGRPINAAALRRELDALALVSPPMSDAIRRVQEELARMGRSRFAPPRAPRERATAAMPLIEGPAATARLQALVVDETDVTLRALSAALEPLDLGWQLARSAPDALERVARDRPRWVFVATGRDSIDGFHTCRMLRHSGHAEHRRPLVMLLLQQDNAVDRLRAQLAGADAVLAAPWPAEALLAFTQAPQAEAVPIMTACSPTGSAEAPSHS